MHFRRLLVGLIVSSFLFESVFAAVSPTDYQSFLNTPQGMSMLKNAKPGQEVSFGSNGAINQPSSNENIPDEMADIENQFSKAASIEGLPTLKLFGYTAFKRSTASFMPDTDSQVPSDYVVGPGDSFKVTLWGISEGIFDVTVNQAGEIVLPKVGVVSVVGIRYGGLQDYITKQLNRYYEQINVSVAMSKIKSIRIYVVGEVNQPGSFTVSSLSTLYSALFQAGGPSKQGSLRNIKLLRDGRTVATVDLYKFLINGDKSQDRVLDSGDTIFVPTRGAVVAITGNIKRPAIYEIKGKADLSELLQLAGGFTSLGYLNRIQIDRVVAHQKRITLDKNFSSSSERANFMVQDMDMVKVYPILDDVQNVVYVQGNFKYVGPYEWKAGMKLKDVISSKDVLKPYSYLPKAEVARMDKQTFQSTIYAIDLEKLFSGDESQNLQLQAGDKILVSSDFKAHGSVTLKGEFRLPGTYMVRKDETLSSVIERAGGFTDDAYLFGAVFTRKSAAQVEETALSRYISDLENKIAQQEINLTSGMVGDTTAAKQMSALEKQKQQIEKLKIMAFYKGRVILKLTSLNTFAGSADDISLEDGDVLEIGKIPNIITVLGEVYSPSSVVYKTKANGNYYVSKVGGVTTNADKDSTYVVKADGSVFSAGKAFSGTLDPGDVIFVPQIVTRTDFWAGVRDWTQFVYQGVLAFAVIATYLK